MLLPIVDFRLPIHNAFCQSTIGNRKSAMPHTLRRFGGLHPLCGIGVVSRIAVTRIPALLMARIADSRPPPGPFTRTSHCCMPASIALRAASYAACCAANGVPLRDPRKPRAPDDDCAIRFPSRSVIEIIVLLNDAAMYAIPAGIFFFSFLRKTFFLPPAAAAFAIISYPVPSSSRQSRGAGLCACAH